MAEALAHRGVHVPLMTCRGSIRVRDVVADLPNGASGMAAPTSSRQRFAAVARAVAAGGLTVLVAVHADARARLAAVTPRQRPVLALLAAGRGHCAVVERLGLAVTTAR